MGFLIGAVLFLLPFGIYLLLRRAQPEGEPSVKLLGVAGVGVVLAVTGFLVYGLGRGMDPDVAYVPATLGADGRIVQPDAVPRAPR
jgi:hypothetical protein